MEWGEYLLKLAFTVSEKSKDPSVKVGCVIVGPSREIRSTGFNGFPRGCNDNIPERNVQPKKYLWFEHAERNAIYNAARCGIPLEGCIMYVTAPPCTNCARGIVQSGIKKIVYPVDHAFKDREDWKEDMKEAKAILNEGGVALKSRKFSYN